jgi:alkaline phosphatase D
MPIGLLVGDGPGRWEASANGNYGPPLGRELEFAGLLRFLKQHKVRNVVWFTADVHYTAAHYYDPRKAKFTDFLPFWEFVSGPLHAGTFGPGRLDATFGPQVVFQKAPAKGQSNLPPSVGLQFFGEVRIDARTKAMTVTLRDLTGAELHRQALAAEGS